MMGTGENLAQCHALDIELYSPSEIDMESDNPALLQILPNQYLQKTFETSDDRDEASGRNHHHTIP